VIDPREEGAKRALGRAMSRKRGPVHMVIRVVLGVLVVAGCAIDATAPDPSSPAEPGAKADTPPFEPEPIVLLEGPLVEGYAFDLIRARVEVGDLVVDVGYRGGCIEHRFELYWNGSTEDGVPPRVRLGLVHATHGDPCDGYAEQTVRFALRSLGGPPLSLAIVGAAGLYFVEWEAPPE
jgi:hypothetical protein